MTRSRLSLPSGGYLDVSHEGDLSPDDVKLMQALGEAAYARMAEETPDEREKRRQVQRAAFDAGREHIATSRAGERDA